MDFFDMLFSGIGSVISAVVGVAKAISTVTSVFSSKKIEPQKIHNDHSRLHDEIHEVNDKIMYLRRRYLTNGRLSEYEKKDYRNLYEYRQALKNEINGNRQILAADKFVGNEEVINRVEVDLETTHILQWNAFADTLGKSCPKCGEIMKLQWRRDLAEVSPNDFYWGCTGWYFKQNNSRTCNHTEKLDQRDYTLLTDTSAPEFSLTADEFSTIIQHDDTASLITERMDDLQADLQNRKKGIDIVCCPVHAEPMKLQKKRNGIGLLDQYYLRCPHWRPDNTGCTYIEKIKSGSQLAALLKNQTGQGIL